MIEILCAGKHFKSMHIWFANDNYTCQAKCDLCQYNGIASLHSFNNENSLQKTLITNLTQTTDEIFAKFAKGTRYKINRSMRDGVITAVFSPESIAGTNGILIDFAEYYKMMYQSKGIDRDIDIVSLQSYINNYALWITSASLDGEILVYHSYVSDNENVRLLHSCSLFRSQDISIQTIIGRANRRLHWDDMQYFKNLGIVCYDWGGIHSFSEPNGIDVFKMDFGGERLEYYNETVACSAKAKLYYRFKNYDINRHIRGE